MLVITALSETERGKLIEIYNGAGLPVKDFTSKLDVALASEDSTPEAVTVAGSMKDNPESKAVADIRFIIPNPSKYDMESVSASVAKDIVDAVTKMESLLRSEPEKPGSTDKKVIFDAYKKLRLVLIS